MSIRRALIVVTLLAATIACDQATKRFASESFSEAVPYPLIGGAVELLYSENEGAFLGWGSRFEERTRFWLFTVGVTGLLGIFGLKLVFSSGPGELVGWSFVLGGGVGNLIDRLVHDGRVIDFLRVGFGSLWTGIFNVADTAIVVGLLFLLSSALSQPRAAPRAFSRASRMA